MAQEHLWKEDGMRKRPRIAARTPSSPAPAGAGEEHLRRLPETASHKSTITTRLRILFWREATKPLRILFYLTQQVSFSRGYRSSLFTMGSVMCKGRFSPARAIVLEIREGCLANRGCERNCIRTARASEGVCLMWRCVVIAHFREGTPMHFVSGLLT